MHSACDIVYDFPSPKDSKKNVCNVLICVLVFLIVYNSFMTPKVSYAHDFSKIVSTMMSSVSSAPLPTADKTSVKEKVKDLNTKDLPLSADAKGSDVNPDAYKTQPESEKIELTKKVKQLIESSDEIVVMFWAPWCPHCHTTMKPFSVASQLSPKVKHLMVNANAISPQLIDGGENSIVKLTHFPFICRMENGKLKKVFEAEPTPEKISSEMTLDVEQVEADPLDQYFH